MVLRVRLISADYTISTNSVTEEHKTFNRKHSERFKCVSLDYEILKRLVRANNVKEKNKINASLKFER